MDLVVFAFDRIVVSQAGRRRFESGRPLFTTFRSWLIYEMRQSRDPPLALWPGPPRAFVPLSERC
jgi:hypothetical protein